MTTPYFGPTFARKEWEVQVPVPVGELCLWCDEPIEEGDIGTIQGVAERAPTGEIISRTQPVHYECSMRSVLGSVSHVQGTCSCNIPGSHEGDPEGMTKREAAIAAVREWKRRQWQA